MFSELVKMGIEDKKRCEEMEQLETFLKTNLPTTTHYTFQNQSAKPFAPVNFQDHSQIRKRKKKCVEKEMLKKNN